MSSFFFVMIREPPRSTLFPTTTPLPFFTSADLATDSVGTAELQAASVSASKLAAGAVGSAALADDSVSSAKILDGSITSARSEEHTSELQSRQYLVCRLLLEKKKHPSHL